MHRRVDRAGVDEAHEVAEPAADHLCREREAGEQLPLEADQELIEVRLPEVRIDPEVVRRRGPVQFAEAVRPEHSGGDHRMLLAQVHELELAAEQRVVVAAIVGTQDRLVIAHDVEREPQPRRERRVAEHAARGHRSAIDVEPQAEVRGQTIGHRPGVLDVPRGALRGRVGDVAVPQRDLIRAAVVVVVASARIAGLVADLRPLELEAELELVRLAGEMIRVARQRCRGHVPVAVELPVAGDVPGVQAGEAVDVRVRPGAAVRRRRIDREVAGVAAVAYVEHRLVVDRPGELAVPVPFGR